MSKKRMIDWARDLFPICRSIAGPGQKETIKYFKKINPEFKILKFKSGTKVFDWVVPDEWIIKDAYIKHEKKKIFCDFKINNLHVVNFSHSINKTVKKKELLKYLHTDKSLPDAIPYITSYYKKRWGFCISENQKKKLPNGKYKVFIDSIHKKGTMDMCHAILKGKKKKEIFFSSYICHPSMVNNELSGPVILNKLMKYIKEKYKKTNYSYRFTLLPETIGSISYLSRYKNILKRNVIAGFNLTCLGDNREYTHLSSRKGNTLADRALQSSLFGLHNVNSYPYLDRGSDERQYCSPGIDLPLCTFSRSKKYKEYHTSKDNFDLVKDEYLEQSLDVLKNIVDAFELCLFPKTKIICEPNLGNRNLYPTIVKKGVYTDDIFLRRDLISYSDGKTDIFEISKIIKRPLKKIISEFKILKKHKILA